ncbi:hypothetical protein ACVW0P_001430 [Mucilaginibacter sp. UYNi724]
MKKLLFVVLATSLFACSQKTLTLGTSEADFLKQRKNASLVMMSPEMTVYKIFKGPYNRDRGTRFYYFHDGKLFLIDQGEKRPNIVIDQTIHNQ